MRSVAQLAFQIQGGFPDMEITITNNEDEACRHAAWPIARLLRSKPGAVLGLATGRTPVLLYQELIRLHREDGLDFSACTTFNLDEYIGLDADHPGSFRRFMQENFFSHVNLPTASTHIPDGLAEDIPKHCAQYEAEIQAAGGIDLQLLGIGVDGHIGFNEPTSSLASRTHLATLTEQTRNANAGFFDATTQVPYHAITMGIATILDCRDIILLAFGEAKAKAVAAMVEGPVTAMVPASALQFHPSVKVIIDEAAASQLSKRKYYRHIARHKPGSQTNALNSTQPSKP